MAENPSKSRDRVPRTRRIGWRGSQSVRNDDGMKTLCGRCRHVKGRHRLGDEMDDGYCLDCRCAGYLEAAADG